VTQLSNDELTDYVSQLIEPYHPLVEVDVLIVELNKIYHKFEASCYDQNHCEIHVQLPEMWSQMISQMCEIHDENELRILDFGCGTGFEAEQFLQYVPHDRIAQFVCYDLSGEMLKQCEQRILKTFKTLTFTDGLNDVLQAGQKFNVLLTNSLLHHLPDPFGMIEKLSTCLTPDAVWLAGHEPSSRFYKNPQCRELLGKYNAEYSWRKFLSPKKYWDHFASVLGFAIDPVNATANAAVKERLFKLRPSPKTVARLVDLHVAHDAAEIKAGRGFDFKLIANDVSDFWKLTWMKSYSFMGPTYEGKLSHRWRVECQRLREEFPLDGANVCCIWQRNQNAGFPRMIPTPSVVETSSN